MPPSDFSRAARLALAACAALAVSNLPAAAEPARASLSGDAPLSRHAVVDQGALPPGMMLERVQLALVRPPALQAALDALTAAQLDPASPEFHRWLTPAELVARFAPPESEAEQAAAWLQQNELQVVEVAGDRMSITFAGAAGQIGRVFGTELHDVVRPDGAHHVANVTAPTIPADLAGVIGGVTLSSFFPRPSLHAVGAVHRDGRTGRMELTRPAPGYTTSVTGSLDYAVAPADLATIYDIGPARSGAAGLGALTGAGVTVIVAEQTDISPSDWSTFRSMFGLSGYPGALSVVHPGGCADPGFTADEGEAALDAEWASAAAPGAKIVEASCAGTATTFGVMTTLQNLVAHGPTGAAVSVSYGGCESGNGASFQSMWNTLIQELAAQGSSVFVSSGDNAVAGCDNDNTATLATTGLNVNGLASPVYDTAVGGTDFADTSEGTNATYWSSTNSSADGSALSYIPEIPWDESCASSVIAQYVGASSGLAFCNQRGNGLLNIVGGSGGRSAVYAKPSWQSGVLGVPADGARGLPDVSLFASAGIWSHMLLFCMSNASEGGAPCVYTNATDFQANAAGGTSFAAPTMAGVQALIVQRTGGALQGVAAPRLYQLAQAQFANSATLNACLSQNGPSGSKSCVFHDVAQGDNAVPCKRGAANCYAGGSRTGVLSTSTSRESDAYPATPGWSFATGLGSVDVTNLIGAY